MTDKILNKLLHEAASQNELETVKQLIAAGASCYAVDEKGLTAFNHAASNGLSVLAWLTEEAFNDTQKPMSERRWQDYDLNTPSGYYASTLITYAAKVSPVSVVKKMIELGADITIVNGSGWTLLHCAAVMPGRLKILKELINAFHNHGLGERINSLTSYVYMTNYNGYNVVYDKNLTAAQLCRSRIEQDPEYPHDIVEYLPYLTYNKK